MKATKLIVRNFRCFASKKLEMEADQVVIQGRNGAGKSSLLEALNYACYAHSFRTRRSEELAKEGENIFYIELETDGGAGEKHKIQIGFDKNKRGSAAKTVKINGRIAKATSEIMRLYRTISITSEDLDLVKGYPESRRNYLNQTLFLLNSQRWGPKLKQFKKTLAQRNALLNSSNKNTETLKAWTEQLWQRTMQIQDERELVLCDIESTANNLVEKHFKDEELKISLKYQRKKTVKNEAFQPFWYRFCKAREIEREYALKRSVFGAHLDDFVTEIFARCARTFASRGEQKLVTLLLKSAQLIVTNEPYQNRGILLLDDFLTDLDQERLKNCTNLLKSLETQVIITCPLDWKALLPQSTKSLSIKL